MEELALDAYFDESGTHQGSPAVSVAGYVARPEQWIAFEGEWKQALSDFGLNRFHMTDFAVRAKPYDLWSEEVRRERFARLADIIDRNVLASVGVVIARHMFESAFTAELREEFGGLYGLAVSSCAMETASLMKRMDPNVWIAYRFERGAKGAGDVAKLFRDNCDDLPRRERYRIRSFELAEKALFPPLQAADILAYELFRELPIKLGIDRRRKRLFHLEPLAKPPHSWVYLTEEALLRFAAVLAVKRELKTDVKPHKKQKKRR